METPFKKYIKKNHINLTQLAKLFNISRVHHTMVANGKPAGKYLALKIEKWSKGNVSRIDLLYPKKR